jgi:SAM-dependent methyltransferase
MTASQSDDARAFKDFERTGWQRAAAGYHDYMGALTRQSVAALLDGVGAGAGARLLDMASGPGYAAGAAAERGARVTGLDFSSEQLSAARRHYPKVTFQQGDAEALPFAAASFEAVVSNFGMLHFAEPERAMAEAFRVLGPGGRFGFTVWSGPEKARGFGLILDAVEAHGDMAAPLPPGPSFFRFSEAAECRRCLGEAGFGAIEVTEMPMTWTLPSAAALVRAAYAGTVRTLALLEAQTPDARAAIDAAMAEAAQAYATAEGALEIPMSAVLATARKG